MLRRLLVPALASTLVLAGVVTAAAALAPSPRTATTEFGFTVSSSLDENSDESSFRADVDRAATEGQTWIRYGIASWLVAPEGGREAIRWNEQALAVVDRELAHIRARGLRVFLVTSGAPDWTGAYAFDDYLRLSEDYWSFLADRFADRVEVWQVFNEADTGHYRTFAELTDLPPTYLAELRRLLGAARTAIHRRAPSVLVTTSSTGHPLDDERETAWTAYFAALTGSLDAVTLDLYPDDDEAAIASLPERVERAAALGLPVLVGEVGMSTCRRCYSEREQGRDVAAAIDALTRAGPRMVIVYEMRDGGPDSEDGESSFGVVRHDGTPKSGYRRILDRMQRPERRP